MSYNKLEGDEQERKLFVGGLNKQCTDEDQLKQFFEHYGDIIDCTIMRDEDKCSRGFGFILFEESTSVDKIIAAKKDGTNFSIDGHRFEIKRALPKVNREIAGAPRHGGLFRKIFVGGLPSSITEDELRKYFESYGGVNEIELLRDRETNRLRGFAFVTFEDEDSADKCVQRRSHDICKKVCEVKRALTRSNISGEEESRGNRRSSSNYDNRGYSGQNNQPSAGNGMAMSEVNRLIQQAFAMGQGVYHQPGMQAPTASSLLNNSLSVTQLNPPSTSNVLLQALMGQQIQPATPTVPPTVAPANNTVALTQLAQLLQGRGIDPTALGTLLKEPEAARTTTTTGTKVAGGGYTTSYPYNYANTQSSYGPAKDEETKRPYRPY